MKKTKRVKKKRYSLAKHKKKVWNLFSIAIRLRDADQNGICTCICCQRQGYYIGDGMQAGHFKSRRFSSTLFDWKNVHAQATYCNTYMQGNQWEYGIALDNKYGEGTADFLSAKSKEFFKIDRIYLEEVEKECLEMIAENAKAKDIWDWETRVTKSQIKYINEYLDVL